MLIQREAHARGIPRFSSYSSHSFPRRGKRFHIYLSTLSPSSFSQSSFCSSVPPSLLACFLSNIIYIPRVRCIISARFTNYFLLAAFYYCIHHPRHNFVETCAFSLRQKRNACKIATPTSRSRNRVRFISSRRRKS